MFFIRHWFAFSLPRQPENIPLPPASLQWTHPPDLFSGKGHVRVRHWLAEAGVACKSAQKQTDAVYIIEVLTACETDSSGDLNLIQAFM